ncbi:MAG: hypothetical protein P1V20_24805 [Verrucomicrobiales bacterium]|nr:hypothetical protein [Verrucomicrobiales bacterium]
MNKRFVVFLLLGLALLGAAEWDIHERVLSPIRKLDRFWIDFCIGNAGNKIGEPSISMVRIPDDYEPVPVGAENTNPQDEKSLTRLDYAAFLYAIGKMNPKAVSFLPTPVFGAKSVLNETTIYPLKDAALQLPRMTLGAIVSSEGKPANAKENVTFPAIVVKGDTSQIPLIAKTTIPADPDFLVNGDPAFVQSESFQPITGAYPRIQLVARQGDKVVPGFVLSSVAKQAGLALDKITLDLESRKPVIQVGDLYTIPVATDGSMSLPSHGGLKHSMYTVSTDANGDETRTYQFASMTVEDVALAAARTDKVAQTLYDEFAGKFQSLSSNLVLLGYDRTSDRTIPTANEEWLSPMTATARAIATIQSGRHIKRWPVPIRAAVYVGIFVLGAILLGFSRKASPLILGAGIAVTAGMVLVFRETLTWTPPFAIFGLFALMFLIGIFSSGKPKKEVTEPEEPTTA